MCTKILSPIEMPREKHQQQQQHRRGATADGRMRTPRSALIKRTEYRADRLGAACVAHRKTR